MSLDEFRVSDLAKKEGKPSEFDIISHNFDQCLMTLDNLVVALTDRIKKIGSYAEKGEELSTKNDIEPSPAFISVTYTKLAKFSALNEKFKDALDYLVNFVG